VLDGIPPEENAMSIRTATPGVVTRHPLLAFFVITYAVSWSLWIPRAVLREELPGGLSFVMMLLGSLVPSAAAILLVALTQGRGGVRALLGRLLRWRVGARWYLVVLAVPLLVPCAFLLGGRAPVTELAVPAMLSIFLFSIFPGSALGEEIGWRGFALPRLQARHSALAASLALGPVWALWHLPLWLTGSAGHPLGLYPAFAVSVVAVSVLYTWIYNSTRGSLLLVVLFHATTNLPVSVFTDALLGAVPVFLIWVALLVVTAAIVAVLTGPAHLSRRHPQLTLAIGQG
jgi:uncharacterized protein